MDIQENLTTHPTRSHPLKRPPGNLLTTITRQLRHITSQTNRLDRRLRSRINPSNNKTDRSRPLKPRNQRNGLQNIRRVVKSHTSQRVRRTQRSITRGTRKRHTNRHVHRRLQPIIRSIREYRLRPRGNGSDVLAAALLAVDRVPAVVALGDCCWR
jgi:transcription initiation factor TFIIIB Brf1 subunit/transcription initiation factor TFIIB